MLCPSFASIDSLGDCCILIINILGLIWITALLLLTYSKYNARNTSGSGLLSPLIDSNSSPLIFFVPNGVVLVRALQLMSIFQIILNFLFFLFQADGCEFAAYYVNVGIRIFGWVEVFIASSYLLAILRTGSALMLYGCIGWGILQLISTGLICSSLLNAFGENSAVVQLTYFIVAFAATSTWIYIYYSSESSNPGTSDISFKNAFSIFRQGRSDLKLSSFVDSTDEYSAPLSSTDMGAPSTATSSMWSSRASVGGPLVARQPKKSDFVDIRLSFDEKSEGSSIMSESFGDRGSRTSKSVDVLRAMDFDGVSINKSVRGPPPPTTGMSTAAVAASKRSTGALRGQLSYAGDCTISVVDWNYVVINGKVVIVYKLGLGESLPSQQTEADNGPSTTTVRIALKRLDEILFLREKVVTDYPSIVVPAVPIIQTLESLGNPPVARNHPDYEKHKQNMSDFLELLITHPIAGHLAMKDLRGSIREKESPRGSLNESGGDIAPCAPDTGSAESGVNQGQGSRVVPTLFPILLWCDNRIEARVCNWTTVEVAKKENKTHYDIEVKLKKGGGMVVAGSEELDEDMTWTVRKRFRQFRAVFISLQRLGLLNSGEQPIVFPTKASKRRPVKGVSRDYDVKLTENAIALDAFLKACCNLRPMPAILLAFFESDICSRACGYDLIMLSADEAVSNETHPDGTGRIILMKSNLTSFAERKEKANQLEQSMLALSNSVKSEIKPLNVLLKSSTNKRIMFFGSASRQNEPTTQTNNSMAADVDADDIDVRMSNDGEVEDDVVVVVEDSKDRDDDNEEEDDEFETTRESLDERGSIGSTGAASSSRNLNASSKGDQPAVGISKKASKLPSMFNFMSSSSAPSPGKANTPEQMLAMSAAPLRDLLDILKYIQADFVSGSQCSSGPATIGAPRHSSHSYFLADMEALSLCSTWKAGATGDSATSSSGKPATQTSTAGNINLVPSNGVWLSQWRVRRALLCTTAFVDWSENVANLKHLNMKTFKLMSNEEKLCFCINLYNLISLHASILIPWPKISDEVGRIVWMRNARYQIGSGSISLLQLEHCILRAHLNNLDLPTFLNTEIPYPAVTELKGFAALIPTGVVDARVPFALALPFRSGLNVQIFHPRIMMNAFRVVTGRYFQKHVHLSRGVVTLPKLLRMNYKDFETWQFTARETAAASYEAVSVTESFTDKRITKSLSAPLSPDPRHRQLSSGMSRRALADADSITDKDKSTEWDIAGQDRLLTQSADVDPHRALICKRPVCIGEELCASSDIVFSEHELQRLVTLLRVGVDVRDRKQRMKLYRSCFIGSDAVRCFLASGDAKTVAQSIAICDMLIQFGLIEHVTHDFWMKDQDLYYIFSELVLGTRQLVQCIVRVVEDHIDDPEMRRQLERSLAADDAIHYGCEDWSFCFPIDRKLLM